MTSSLHQLLFEAAIRVTSMFNEIAIEDQKKKRKYAYVNDTNFYINLHLNRWFTDGIDSLLRRADALPLFYRIGLSLVCVQALLYNNVTKYRR